MKKTREQKRTETLLKLARQNCRLGKKLGQANALLDRFFEAMNLERAAEDARKELVEAIREWRDEEL